MDSATEAFKAVIETNLRAKVRAELRAEIEAEINAERVALGKRLISKQTVWLKLGISEDTLDQLRRTDPNFPKPKKIAKRALHWREHEIDGYIDAD